MSHDPQNTLGLKAVKHYNDMKMIRLEALSCLKFETNNGDTVRAHTLSKYHRTQLLDYVTMQIRHPTIEPTMHTRIINSTNANKEQKIDSSLILTTTMRKIENIFYSRESAIPRIEK